VIEDKEWGRDAISGTSSTAKCASEGVWDEVREAEGSDVDEGFENVGAGSGRSTVSEYTGGCRNSEAESEA